jgi:hypothetical protein
VSPARLRRLGAAAVVLAVLWGGGPGAAWGAERDEPTPAGDVTVTVPPETARVPGPPVSGVPGTAPASGAPTTPRTGGGAGDPQTPAGPPTEPAIGPAPSTTGEKAATDKEHYLFGETVTVTMGGFAPGEQVQIVLYSQPRPLGNVGAGGDGVLTHAFVLPDDLPPGRHTVQLTGWVSQRVGTVEIFVTAPPVAASSTQGVPRWVWWVAGGLGAVLLSAGGWWLARALRAPDAAEAVS